jgi:hypothetical protein
MTKFTGGNKVKIPYSLENTRLSTQDTGENRPNLTPNPFATR